MKNKDYYIQTVVMRPCHKDFNTFMNLCKDANSLYNYFTFYARKKAIKYGARNVKIGRTFLYRIEKHATEYHENNLYNKLSNGIVAETARLVDQNFESYKKALKAYDEDPDKFTGKPKMPKFHKKGVAYELTLIANNFIYDKSNNQIIWTKRITKRTPEWKKDLLPIKLDDNIDINKVIEIKIKPYYDRISFKICYEIEKKEKLKDNGKYLGIDPGMKNMITCASNLPLRPIIYSGGPVLSINQFANKKMAHYRSVLSKCNQGDTSKRISEIRRKRNDKIEKYFHEVSKSIVEYALSHDIHKIIIGKGTGSKNNSKMGRRNNQNFHGIPHSRLFWMITYKANMEGIDVVFAEESYTSQTSALDNELPIKENGNDSRRKKGLTPAIRRKTTKGFITNKGIIINADVNGALQIIRKEVPNIIFEGIEDVVIRPLCRNYLI